MRNKVLSVLLALTLAVFMPTLAAFADEGPEGAASTEQSGALATMAEPITNVIITRINEDQFTVEFDSDGSGGDFYIDPLANGTSISGASMGGSAGLLVAPGHKELPWPFNVGIADAVALALFQSDSEVWSGTYPIPAWDPPAADMTPPVLSNGKFLGWIDHPVVHQDVATFTFDTDEGGIWFLEAVNHGDPAPDMSYVATAADNQGAATPAGTITWYEPHLTPSSPAMDFYVCVRDAAGNVSQPLVISTLTPVHADIFNVLDSPFVPNTWRLYCEVFDLIGANTVQISISYPYESGTLVEYWTTFDTDDPNFVPPTTEVNGGLTVDVSGLADTSDDRFCAGLDWSKSFAGEATIIVAVDGVTRYTTTIAGTLAPPSPPTDYPVVAKFPTYDGKGDVSAQINAPFAEFVQLTLDGKVIDPANYTIAEDTSTITLAKSYLDTLGKGEYLFVVEFSGGTAQLPLSIQTTDTENTTPVQDDTILPKTGDTIAPLATALLLLAGGTALLLRARRHATRA
ncbi:MAG: LPXTG cell wall anchor domain-containing protein [Coriobacteriales bacterium]|jgi:LPXTG-motif cell wall-anchored protein|nr:LPXTG cell wall anchor domain-containing protein [Coriobacteriales bacterium]